MCPEEGIYLHLLRCGERLIRFRQGRLDSYTPHCHDNGQNSIISQFVEETIMTFTGQSRR
jgi:hypothetical protein